MYIIYGVRCNDETALTSWRVNTRNDRYKSVNAKSRVQNIIVHCDFVNQTRNISTSFYSAIDEYKYVLLAYLY